MLSTSSWRRCLASFRVDPLIDAKELLSKLSFEGSLPDVSTYNKMVKGCKAGLVDEALKVFRQMETSVCFPNSCSYNLIIQVYFQSNGSAKLIDEMVGEGFPVDASTMELIIYLVSKKRDDPLVKKLLSSSKAFSR